MSSYDQFQVGAKVAVKSRPGERGTIRFRGEITGKPGLFFGIALNKATGKNDGTLNSEHYFTCKPNHGTFVRGPNLKLVTPAPSMPSSVVEMDSTYETANVNQSQSNRHPAHLSHQENERYMENFEKGFAALGMNNNNDVTGRIEGKNDYVDSFSTDLSTNSRNNSKNNINNNNNNNRPIDSAGGSTRARKGDMYGKGHVSTIPLVECSSSFRKASASSMSTTDSSPSLSSVWTNGPINGNGDVVDLSDRNLMCSDVHVQSNKCVIGGSDHKLYVIDVTSGKLDRTLYSKQYGHAEWVSCVAYCPDGRVVSGGLDSKLCLWDTAARRSSCVDLLGHTGSVSQVMVLERGNVCVSASYDKTLRLWNIQGGRDGRSRSGGDQTIGVLAGHTAPVLEMCVSDGHLCSGSRDGAVLLWDLTTAQASGQYTDHAGHITALESSNTSNETSSDGGGIFYSGDQQGTVRAIDPRTRDPVASHCAHPGGAVNELALCPSQRGAGHLIVSAGADGKVCVLDTRQGLSPATELSGGRDFVYSLHVDATTAFTGFGDGMMLVHDILTGTLHFGAGANQAGVRCIETVGRDLVVAGDDGNAMLYHF